MRSVRFNPISSGWFVYSCAYETSDIGVLLVSRTSRSFVLDSFLKCGALQRAQSMNPVRPHEWNPNIFSAVGLNDLQAARQNLLRIIQEHLSFARALMVEDKISFTDPLLYALDVLTIKNS